MYVRWMLGLRRPGFRRVSCLLVTGVLVCSGLRLHADRLSLLPFNRPSGKFAQALDLLARGDLRAADALLQEVVEREPGQVSAALAQVQIAVTEQRLEAAERAVSAILKREPGRPEAYTMQGVVAMLQKHPESARRAFVHAIELRPTYVTPVVYLGALERAGGNYDGAVTAYERLIGIAPRLPAGYLGAAEALIMLRKPANAFSTLENWRRADPKSPLPAQVIGQVHLSRGEIAQAIAVLKASLQIHPGDPGTLTSLGTAYAAGGDTAGAAAQFNAALVTDKTFVDAFLGLGDLEAAAGATDRALVQYRRGLAIRPDHPVVCNNVAWVLAERGQDLGEALRLAKVAASADPDYVDAQDTLGWVLYRRGEYSAAIAALQHAKIAAPTRADIAAHLGLAYARAGRSVEALSELKRALGAGPTLPQRAEVERTVAQLSVPASRPGK